MLHTKQLEGLVISAHSLQVARFLFIDSDAEKGRSVPAPKNCRNPKFFTTPAVVP